MKMHQLKQFPVKLQGTPLKRLKRLVKVYLWENHEILSKISDFDQLARALEEERWYDLFNLADSLSSQLYDDATQHFVANQLFALFKKYPFPPSAVPEFKPREAATRKFMSAEHRCKWVNRKFNLLSKGSWNRHEQVFEYARKWINRTLGDEPDLEKILARCDFGPGATLDVTGDATCFARKLLSKTLSCTPSALPYALNALWLNHHYRVPFLTIKDGYECWDYEDFRSRVSDRVEMVSHNKISFVPKTAKVDRPIAVEPTLNGFVQKGIDLEMRDKLRKVGIDLSDQEPNQLLAMHGSIMGANPYATIDLSAASDSVSLEFARYLLPPAWFSLLNNVRCPDYELDGVKYRYEKIASMGNGFCFPLETLLFASLIVGVTKTCHAPLDFRVYGDDIVIRRDLALYLIEVLRFSGFSTNTDKTFVFGKFRESCGEDWFDGRAVRPVYITNDLSDVRHLFVVHNTSLRESAKPYTDTLREELRYMTPKEIRFCRTTEGPANTAFEVTQDVFLCCDHVTWVPSRFSFKWKELMTQPVEDPLRHDLHHVMAWTAVLRGSASEQPFSVRHQTRTQVRWVPNLSGVINRRHPSWDHESP